jgi:hypothetical protein
MRGKEQSLPIGYSCRALSHYTLDIQIHHMLTGPNKFAHKEEGRTRLAAAQIVEDAPVVLP